jgi:hypothetical protein
MVSFIENVKHRLSEGGINFHNAQSPQVRALLKLGLHLALALHVLILVMPLPLGHISSSPCSENIITDPWVVNYMAQLESINFC